LNGKKIEDQKWCELCEQVNKICSGVSWEALSRKRYAGVHKGYFSINAGAQRNINGVLNFLKTVSEVLNVHACVASGMLFFYEPFGTPSRKVWQINVNGDAFVAQHKELDEISRTAHNLYEQCVILEKKCRRVQRLVEKRGALRIKYRKQIARNVKTEKKIARLRVEIQQLKESRPPSSNEI
jgi:uncharacterized Fe-S radical SAM superfamily protein PflX